MLTIYSLAPKYEELGSLYPASSNVIVAKVDATANDVPDEIQGFPTIKLFPAGKKSSPVDYSGSRTVEDLANFIRDHGTHAYDGLKPSDAADDIAQATEGMPQQAMAATGAAGKVAAAAKAVVDALVDDEGGQADHDEL